MGYETAAGAGSGIRDPGEPPGYGQGPAVIREDRELLAELARLNADMPSLALRIMEGSAGTAEQEHYAQRLVVAGQCLRRRAEGLRGAVVEGEVEIAEPLVLPPYTVESLGSRPAAMSDGAGEGQVQ